MLRSLFASTTVCYKWFGVKPRMSLTEMHFEGRARDSTGGEWKGVNLEKVEGRVGF